MNKQLAYLSVAILFSLYSKISADKNSDLINAIKACNEGLVTNLLSSGADANAVDASTGYTALHTACQCSSCFSLSILTSLVKKGANVNAQTAGQYPGYTPLIFTSQCLGDTTKIKAITDYVAYLVLAKNANTNLQTYFGATALALGVRSDQAISAFLIILSRTTNCNTRQWGGNTPLCWAQQSNLPLTIDALKAYGGVC